jgi:hypothetical protein
MGIMTDWTQLPFTPDSNESIFDEYRGVKRLKRRLLAKLIGFSSAALGRPLQTHVVICGFPRSGTTLLQSMLEYGYPRARRFEWEISAARAITRKFRRHEMMITKRPPDLLFLHRLENYYRSRRAQLRAIVMIRDPRDVLVSKHAAYDRPYFLDPKAWAVFNARYHYHRNDPEVLTVRYEDLVLRVGEVQRHIEAFLGRRAERAFEDFHKQSHSEFVEKTLNGVRPLDASSIGRWRDEKHRTRMVEVLRTLPGFAGEVIGMGYEQDADWTQEYLSPADMMAVHI